MKVSQISAQVFGTLLGLLIGWSHPPAAEAQEPCAAPGTVVVDRSMTLNPACNFSRVRFVVTGSGTAEAPLVLDCNGATITGPGSGSQDDIGIYIFQARDLSTGTYYPTHVNNVVVKNCNVKNFGRGIEINFDKLKPWEKQVHDLWVSDDAYDRRVKLVEPLMDLRRTQSPQNIKIQNVTVSGTSVGVFVGNAVTGVTISGSRISGGEGVYLEYSSSRNFLFANVISGEGDGAGAVMIDSSSRNTLFLNTFRNSGVYLYKNCYERMNPLNRSSPRSQHSYNNWIIGNTFESPLLLTYDSSPTTPMVWVALRQSMDRDHQNCSDPVYKKVEHVLYNERYYRDYAENTVIEHNDFRDGSRIVIEGDGTVVKHNTFSGSTVRRIYESPVDGQPYIRVGSWARSEKNEPLLRTAVFANSFAPQTDPLVNVPSVYSFGARLQGPATDGDVDGDGKSDFLCHNRTTGTRKVQYASRRFNGQGPLDLSVADNFCTHNGATLYTGDTDGDGRSDLICHDRLSGDLWIQRADAFGDYTPGGEYLPLAFCNHTTGELRVGDFNGDLRDDLLCHDRADGRNWIVYADINGAYSFATSSYTATGFCSHPSARVFVGDFNGDNRDDLLCHDVTSGAKWIDYANDSGTFAAPSGDFYSGANFCTHSLSKLFLGDVNGDNRADMICQDYLGHTFIQYTDAQGHFGASWASYSGFCALGSELFVRDYNGDGRDDLGCNNVYTGKKWVDYADADGHFGATAEGDWQEDAHWCDSATGYML